MDTQVAKGEKSKAFKEAAARQRGKIKGMKADDTIEQNGDMMAAMEERMEALGQMAE